MTHGGIANIVSDIGFAFSFLKAAKPGQTIREREVCAKKGKEELSLVARSYLFVDLFALTPCERQASHVSKWSAAALYLGDS